MRDVPLTHIANRYGTDKGTEGPDDTWPAHNYTDIYEAYLLQLRNQRIRLLEIGMGVQGDRWESRIVRGRNTGGASIKMWAEYFREGEIFGIDINPARYLDTDRVRTFVADQGNQSQLREVVDQMGHDPFDVIIDDGSHRADHQQLTFSILFDRLKPGGLYFIEDLFQNDIVKNDPSDGRPVIQTLNTREVFRSVCETGQFGGPNALAVGGLESRISWIRFHCPLTSTRIRPTGYRRHPLRAVKKFRYGSEQLCVIGHT